MTGDKPNRGGDADHAGDVGDMVAMDDMDDTGDTVSVESFATVLADDATWAEPPADLLDRIIAAGAPDAPLTPVVPLRRRSWTRTLAAVAAATVVVFGAGFLVGIARDEDPPAAAEDELVAQLALVGTDLAPSATASVDVFDRGAGYALILQTTGLDPAPVGDYYEGWLSSDDDVAVSVGTFHMRGGDGTVVLWSGVAVADFPNLSVRRHQSGADGDDAVVMTGMFVADDADR